MLPSLIPKAQRLLPKILTPTLPVQFSTSPKDYKVTDYDTPEVNSHRQTGHQDPKTVPSWFLDLANVHQPMGTFGGLPSTNDQWKLLWEKYKLTDDQLRRYRRDGFLSNIEIFSGAECDLLLGEVMEVIADGYPGRGLFSEFYKNETGDPEMAVCHGLGHWRCTKG